jgi:TatA/E family protein of Tat protein translocase
VLFILVLALLVFGPRRLPELGRTIGRAMGEFRRASTDLRRTLNNELALEDETPRRPAAAPPPRPRPVEDGSAIVPSAAAGSAPREAPGAPRRDAGAQGKGGGASGTGGGERGEVARAPASQATAPAPPEPPEPPEPIEPR